MSDVTTEKPPSRRELIVGMLVLCVLAGVLSVRRGEPTRVLADFDESLLPTVRYVEQTPPAGSTLDDPDGRLDGTKRETRIERPSR